jgi:hypothetical protein
MVWSKRICSTSSPLRRSTWCEWQHGWRTHRRLPHDVPPLPHWRHRRVREPSMGIRHQYLSWGALGSQHDMDITTYVADGMLTDAW